MIRHIVVALAVATVLGACASRNNDLLLPDDYRSWPQKPTDDPLDFPVPGHVDNFRIIYTNRTGTTRFTREVDGRTMHGYAIGTIILKEIYDGLEQPEDGEEPIRLVAMIKRPDDPNAQGGWLWVVKDTVSNEEQVITHRFCLECHSNANERHPYGDRNRRGEFRDYVFYPYSEE